MKKREAETHRRPAGRHHDRDSPPCRAVSLAAHLYAVTEAPEPISSLGNCNCKHSRELLYLPSVTMDTSSTWRKPAQQQPG
ncbi:unnamed protein product [Arctogadus glacialis]